MHRDSGLGQALSAYHKSQDHTWGISDTAERELGRQSKLSDHSERILSHLNLKQSSTYRTRSLTVL